jgi:hypothetical protein
LTDVSNLRISDRLLRRWGWEAHCPSRWHRHFIKRYYGTYPDPADAWQLMSPTTCAPAPALQSDQAADTSCETDAREPLSV